MRKMRMDYVPACLIAFLPWLQIKFTAAALLLAIAHIFFRYRQDKSIAKAFVPAGILALSVGMLTWYNNYAFGEITGPYSEGALQLSPHSLMVLAGLHIDRFQGFFIQNPAYFLGLLFAVPFFRRFRLTGGIILLVYSSLLVPNALHPNWYGGYSFAGRFALSGSLVILPVVLFGLLRVVKDLRYGKLLVILFVALNIHTYSRYTFKFFNFYNLASSDEYALNTQFSEYPSFYPVLNRFLPVLYDSGRAFQYPPNLAFLVFFIGLLVLGSTYKEHGKISFYGRSAAVTAVFLAIIVAAGCLGGVR